MKRSKIELAMCLLALATLSPLRANAGLIIEFSAAVTPAAGGLEQYAYTLTNSDQSTVSVYGLILSVDAGANLQSIESPTGWDATYSPGDASIIWSSPAPETAVVPGASATFGFLSVEPPVFGDYQAIGFDPDSFQFYSNPGTTSVPGISSIPEPCTPVLLSIGILTLIGCAKLGKTAWVIPRALPGARDRNGDGGPERGRRSS
jgi:hypothetical protein